MPPLPFPDGPQEYELSGTSYRVVPVVKGLVNPWSLTFLPNGDMLVTEKPGPPAHRPQRHARSAAGCRRSGSLGDRAGRPARSPARIRGFSENQLLYLTYSKPCEQGATTALLSRRGSTARR